MYLQQCGGRWLAAGAGKLEGWMGFMPAIWRQPTRSSGPVGEGRQHENHDTRDGPGDGKGIGDGQNGAAGSRGRTGGAYGVMCLFGGGEGQLSQAPAVTSLFLLLRSLCRILMDYSLAHDAQGEHQRRGEHLPKRGLAPAEDKRAGALWQRFSCPESSVGHDAGARALGAGGRSGQDRRPGCSALQ